MRKLLAAIAVVATFAAGNAAAQTYPSRPVTMVVPYAPGGPTDTIARIMAEHMRGSLGQPVIIENVSGAGGSIGVARVARATPDGYALSVGNLSSHVMNGAVYALPYDLIADFAPVALLSFQPMLIVARKSLPADDLRGLVAWLKANAGKATVGIQGVGTAGHVFAVFFQKEIGTPLALVPYRGAGPAMQDLLAGQIDCMIDTPTNSLPQVRGGTIKAYAVTAESRLASAPDIPTVDEAGLGGFHFSFWQALWAPKGTPAADIDKLNAAVVASLADPAIRQRFAEQGQEVPAVAQQTPQALAAYHKAEIEKWWPIVKGADIKAE
jgi:tripartite-type tricarboxylate transporter receptor subunit TctC